LDYKVDTGLAFRTDIADGMNDFLNICFLASSLFIGKLFLINKKIYNW